MTTPAPIPRWRGFVWLIAATFALLCALCTVFALCVTVAQAWQERAHSQWPQVTARVQSCGLAVYRRRSETYWINCTIGYTVRGKDFVSRLHSRSTPAPRTVIGKDPTAPLDRMQEWVDDHPSGTPIAVHYDPADPQNAVLVITDMPNAGLQTPNNLKLLGFFAVSFGVLTLIARIAKPRLVKS